MDIISVVEMNHIYWLGRYTERVYTTVLYYLKGRDRMIEDPEFYITYCKDFTIPNCYTSAEDFLSKYIFDEENPDSILSNLNRAYDNAIVLRHTLGTETLSYMELAVNQLKHSKDSVVELLDLQKVLDYILAFWACIDDYIDSEQIRSVIKVGRHLERLNLYLRLRKGKECMMKPFHMLVAKLRKGYLDYDREALNQLGMNLTSDSIDYWEGVRVSESLIREKYN